MKVTAQDAAESFCLIDLEKFLSLELPPQEDILSPWLGTQGLALIYAPRGIGKTHVALGIAYAVASGGRFLRWKAPKPRGVLYLDGEMPANMMQERLSAIVASNPEKVTESFKILTPDLQPMMSTPDLSTQRGQTAIEPFLEKIDLIIVDNLATLCRSGNENDTEAWKPVQEWALRMRASGRSVLFIHHAGKKGAQRGASAREDTLNVVLRLSRPEIYAASEGAVFEVYYEKSRGLFGESIAPFRAKLSQDGAGKQLWTTENLDPSKKILIATRLKEGYKQHEIAKELNLHKSTISRYANQAKEEGLLKSCKVSPPIETQPCNSSEKT